MPCRLVQAESRRPGIPARVPVQPLWAAVRRSRTSRWSESARRRFPSASTDALLCDGWRRHTPAPRPDRDTPLRTSRLTRLRIKLRQFAHLLQVLEGQQRLGLIDHADGKTDVHDDVLALVSFRDVSEADFLYDPAEADSRHARKIFAVDA